jgi:hypothetical protein
MVSVAPWIPKAITECTTAQAIVSSPQPAPLSIRQRLLAGNAEVLTVARRYGASNLRLFGSVALGFEPEGSD